MAFVNKFSSVCFKEGCVKIAQGRMTRRKPKVETGMRETLWEVPEPRPLFQLPALGAWTQLVS